MPYPIEEKLVIAVASSVIFDLTEADAIFRDKGELAYREYTLDNENRPFDKGPAFDFIRRLLAVNSPETLFEPVEVILLSRNNADTGNRVLKSLEYYNLPVGRAAFTSGRKPLSYIHAFNAALFLSANGNDVKEALTQGRPAGLIMLPSRPVKEPEIKKGELKIAFDFDGIIADGSSEKIYQKEGLEKFNVHEKSCTNIPMPPGPLLSLFEKISAIQQEEFKKQAKDKAYKPKIRTAIITARMAPAHNRVIHTLRHWGIHVDEAFFLGGISKSRVLSVFKPHIFFDDQLDNLCEAPVSMAMVHVPGEEA